MIPSPRHDPSTETAPNASRSGRPVAVLAAMAHELEGIRGRSSGSPGRLRVGRAREARFGGVTVWETGRELYLDVGASIARLELSSLEGAVAGYVRVLRPLEYRTTNEVIDTLRLLVSQPGGSVSAAEEARDAQAQEQEDASDRIAGLEQALARAARWRDSGSPARAAAAAHRRCLHFCRRRRGRHRIDNRRVELGLDPDRADR